MTQPSWSRLLRYLHRLDRQPPMIIGRWTRADIHDGRRDKPIWYEAGARGLVMASRSGGGARA